MHGTLRIVTVSLIAVLAFGFRAAADEPQTICPFNGKNLDGWACHGGTPAEGKWTVGVAKVDPSNDKALAAEPTGSGPAAMISPTGHGKDIYTTQKFGDCTIEVELMIPKGSNSGVYLMGEYEIQVLDSYGKQTVGPGDMGGLYHTAAPKVNAAGKPGEWQKYVIEFIAPRFDQAGKKTANAKLVKVTLNGQVIHENLEIPQQTPGGVTGKEVAAGPLMFQGNHGPVAYRNIKVMVPAKK